MAENIRETILNAGTEAFAQYGYDKTTIEDIARLAHKAKTSIYYYFNGKAEIFEAVIRGEFCRIMDQLRTLRVMPSEGHPEILRNYLKERMEAVTGSALFRRFAPAQYSGSGGGPEEIVRRAREEFDNWEKDYFNAVCSYGRTEGILNPGVSPDTFADMLEMLLKGVEAQFIVSKDESASRSTYNEMVDFLIRCNNCKNE